VDEFSLTAFRSKTMASESYDEAYRRGKEEAQGTRARPFPAAPANDSVRQGYVAGKSDGSKSGQK
jgi:hypothetical protein